MSRFNTDTLCMRCASEECKRDDYKAAVDSDNAAIRAGNYNFEGIGL